jgi:hypothetical protein
MPPDMKGWLASQDLQQRIDKCVDIMPLPGAVSNPAVQDVHGKQIIELRGYEIDIHCDVFHLSHVFDAGLLNFKNEVHGI